MASSIDDNEADKKSDKETDMNTEPQILMYNFQEEKRTHLIRQYLNRAGIGIRVVQTPDFLESLGYLFGLPGFSRNPQFNMGNNFSDEMIVLKDFSREQLDSFLAFFRQNGLKSVSLKAVLTPVTQHWTSMQLYEELRKEHEAMQRPNK